MWFRKMCSEVFNHTSMNRRWMVEREENLFVNCNLLPEMKSKPVRLCYSDILIKSVQNLLHIWLFCSKTDIVISVKGDTEFSTRSHSQDILPWLMMHEKYRNTVTKFGSFSHTYVKQNPPLLSLLFIGHWVLIYSFQKIPNTILNLEHLLFSQCLCSLFLGDISK